MYKWILPVALILFTACGNANNSDRKDTNASSKNSSTALPADSMARVATFSFIDGCMQNARITLGDEKAFAFCKCIYDQLRAQNPNADSVAIEELATDTARVAKMAANCR